MSPHRFARWCGAVVMLAGVFVLLGQMFDFPVLTKFVSGYVNMKPNTALCFVLSGGALWLLQMPGRHSVRLARFCAGILGGIALLTLLEYAGGWNLLIDDLLARGRGRTGVFSALCFASLAAGLWLMSRPPGTPRRSLVVGRIGLFVGIIGLLAVLGRLGGFRIGYGWFNFTAMAMFTASLFVLLGAALAVFAWREAGQRWLIKPWITAGFVAALALLIGVAALSYRSTKNLVEAADWVKHTHEVLSKVNELRSSVDEQQSGMGGYVITGNVSFLPRSRNAGNQVLNQLQELRELTSDNAAQQRRIALLEKQINDRMPFVAQAIELRASRGFDAAAAWLGTGNGMVMLDAIREQLREIGDEEQQLLQARAADSKTITARTLAMLPLGTGLSLVFLGLGMLRLNREMAARKRGAEALRQSDRRLRMALDAADIGEWAMNPVTLAARRSLKHDQIFGYAEMLPEWNYAMFLDHVHPEDRGRVDQEFQESVVAGRDWEFDCRIIRHDGTPGWIWARGMTVRDTPGDLMEMLGMVRDITARKEAEEALREREQEFRSLAEAVPQIVWATRPDGWNIYFNQKWVDYTGLTQEESRGHGWNIPFHPDDRQRAWEAWQGAVQHNEPYSLECRLRRADGVYRWWLIRSAPKRSANGEVQKWFGTCTDIDDLMQAEQALRQSEEFNRSIIKSSPDCIKVLDLEGNLLSMEAGLELLGITDLAPLLGKPWIGFWEGADDCAAARAAVATAAAGGEGHFAGFFRTLRGEDKWWDVAITPIRDADGKPARLLAVSRDVTQRQQAEEVLRQSAAQFETLVNEAPLGVLLIDADFRIRQVNPTALPAYGNIPDLMGRDYAEILHILWPEAQADAATKQFRHTLETGEPCFVPEMIEKRADRQTTEYYEWQINRIPLPDGRHGVVCYFRDISERVLAQQEIRESEERYRSLFNSMDEGFCIIELIFDESQQPVDWRYLEVNPSFETLTGIHDIVGKRIRDLVPDHEGYWFEIYGKVVLTGEPVRFVNEAKGLDRWFDLYAFRVGGAGSLKVAVLFTNITERKRAEELLIRFSQELESRVVERTAELETAVAALELEIIERQRLEREILEVSEREQCRLGQDLHDGLGQELAGIALLGDTLAKHLSAEPHLWFHTAARQGPLSGRA